MTDGAAMISRPFRRVLATLSLALLTGSDVPAPVRTDGSFV